MKITAIGAVIAATAMAGCSSPADKAEKRYAFLKEQHATNRDVCAAGREWVRALSDRQDERYGQIENEVSINCQSGEFDGLDQRYGLPPIEPDNMDVEPSAIANENGDAGE